jgi:hypothetical protein
MKYNGNAQGVDIAVHSLGEPSPRRGISLIADPTYSPNRCSGHETPPLPKWGNDLKPLGKSTLAHSGEGGQRAPCPMYLCTTMHQPADIPCRKYGLALPEPQMDNG